MNGTEKTPISEPRVTPQVSRLLSALSPTTVTKKARPSVWNMYEPPFSAIRSPTPTITPGRPWVKISLMGRSAICSCFSSSMNVGVSRSRIRMNSASRISAKEARKGTRHPQLSSWSSGSSVIRPNTTAASSVPAWMPTNGSAEKKPRRFTGAYSAISTVAPACSAPAPKPCSSRISTSRIGAHTPIAA